MSGEILLVVILAGIVALVLAYDYFSGKYLKRQFNETMAMVAIGEPELYEAIKDMSQSNAELVLWYHYDLNKQKPYLTMWAEMCNR